VTGAAGVERHTHEDHGPGGLAVLNATLDVVVILAFVGLAVIAADWAIKALRAKRFAAEADAYAAEVARDRARAAVVDEDQADEAAG